MTDRVTNADLYGVLMTIKEDIGGLKATTEVQLKGLENHGSRLVALEARANNQKGSAKVWTLVGSSIGAILGGASAILAAWWQKH